MRKIEKVLAACKEAAGVLQNRLVLLETLLIEHGGPLATPIAPPADDPISARAGRFCEWFRLTAYPTYRKASYVSNEHQDFEAARQLCRAYPDGKRLKDIAEIFLQIPEERETFLQGKTRTLGMLRSMASAIEERLNQAR